MTDPNQPEYRVWARSCEAVSSDQPSASIVVGMFRFFLEALDYADRCPTDVRLVLTGPRFVRVYPAGREVE